MTDTQDTWIDTNDTWIDTKDTWTDTKYTQIKTSRVSYRSRNKLVKMDFRSIKGI